jgi:hypothetical protein
LTKINDESKLEGCSKLVVIACLKLDHLTLLLLVTAELEVLAPLDGQLLAHLALGAFHLQYNLLGRLGLFVENGLRLTTVALLLSVVSPLALGKQGILSLLVLRDLVQRVLAALLSLAERSSLLRYIHLCTISLIKIMQLDDQIER